MAAAAAKFSWAVVPVKLGARKAEGGDADGAPVTKEAKAERPAGAALADAEPM